MLSFHTNRSLFALGLGAVVSAVVFFVLSSTLSDESMPASGSTFVLLLFKTPAIIPTVTPTATTAAMAPIMIFVFIISVPFLTASVEAFIPAPDPGALTDADRFANETGIGLNTTCSDSFMKSFVKNGIAIPNNFVSFSSSYFSTSFLILFLAKFRRRRTVPSGTPSASAISLVLMSSK